MPTNRKKTTKKGKSPEARPTRTHIQPPEGQGHFDLGLTDFQFVIPADTSKYGIPEEKIPRVEHQESVYAAPQDVLGSSDQSGEYENPQQISSNMKVSPTNSLNMSIGHTVKRFKPFEQAQNVKKPSRTLQRLPNINEALHESSDIGDLGLGEILAAGNMANSGASAAQTPVRTRLEVLQGKSGKNEPQHGQHVMRPTKESKNTPRRRPGARKPSNLPSQQGALIGLINKFCEKLKQIQTIYDETSQVPEYISFADIMNSINMNIQDLINIHKSRDLQQSITKYNELSNNLETIKLMIAYNIYVWFNQGDTVSAKQQYDSDVEYILYDIKNEQQKNEINAFFSGDPKLYSYEQVIYFISKLNEKDQAVKPKLDEINTIIENGDDAEMLSVLGQLQGHHPYGASSRHAPNNDIQALEAEISSNNDGAIARTRQNMMDSYANAEIAMQNSKDMVSRLQTKILPAQQYVRDFAIMQLGITQQSKKTELEKKIHKIKQLLKNQNPQDKQEALQTKLNKLKAEHDQVSEIVKQGKQFTEQRQKQYETMLAPEGESEGAQPEQARHASGSQSPAPAAKAGSRGTKEFFSRRTQERKTSPQRPTQESEEEEVSGQEIEPEKKPGLLRRIFGLGKSKKNTQGGGKSIKLGKHNRQTKKKQTLGNRRN